MRLILPIILNIAMVVLFLMLEKKGILKKENYFKNQIIIGLCFGLVAAFSSSFGVEVLGIVINVRDAAPISAGLIFSPIAGIISGLVGGLYRALSVLWDASTYTMVACTISTIVAGCSVAILKKYMFDYKRPSLSYAIGITVVIEVFHMLMIFITNINDADNAFIIVKNCTILMIIANSISVGISILITSIIKNEFKFRKEKKDKTISEDFQTKLLLTLLISFIVTSFFTYDIQSTMATKQTNEMFTVEMNDIIKDINDESNKNLLEIANIVKYEYERNKDIDLNTLLITENYEIKEINVVSNLGIIVKSNDNNNLYYDMNSIEQSRQFMILINQDKEKTFVQSYGINSKGLYRKYAGISLSDGGFIQVGYDKEQFQNQLDKFVIAATKNRHIGTQGFIAICDESFNLITDDQYNGLHISSIGITPTQEMLEGKKATKISKTIIVDETNNYSEKYIFVHSFSEGYCVVLSLPQIEVMLIRDSSLYLSLFTEVIVFAILFVIIFYLIKKKIINNLHMVNVKLSEITSGNLDVEVNVRTSEEFSSLSDDINLTVSALKKYISEAETRIDNELKYAKQIQLAALPNDFLDNEQISIYALMDAAKEVGGDFYDFYYINDNTLAFLVADVSGKGIPAAMFMMRAKTIIKSLAESGLEVHNVLMEANKKICDNNESGMFVTAWMGILDITTGKLEYANAGHNPPLLYKDNQFSYLKTRPGLVLGGIDNIIYKKNEINLKQGDRLFLYTDGVTEAHNINKELYGEENLLNFLTENHNLGSRLILKLLREDIDRFSSGIEQFDDITMMMIDYSLKTYIVEKEFSANKLVLSDVLNFVENKLDEFNCANKDKNSILIAIEEVFVNIANYAYDNDKGNCIIEIKYNDIEKAITFDIKDHGKQFNPILMEDPDVSLSANERNVGGLGIFMVKKLMDEVSYKFENEFNILILKKKL